MEMRLKLKERVIEDLFNAASGAYGTSFTEGGSSHEVSHL